MATDELHDRLETGYDASTPVEDTYVRRFLLNWSESNASITKSLGGHELSTERFRAADTGRMSTYANSATLLQPLGVDARPTLQAIEEFYRQRDGNEPREVYLFSAWPTPDLREYGWLLGGHPPVHLLPANNRRTRSPERLRIERVTTAADLRILEQIAIDGYPFHALAPGTVFGPSLIHDSNLRFWLGKVDESPVGLAISSINHGINQVMLIVTLRHARRHGYGEALTWEAALGDSTLPAMLLSSDLGRPVYERMGFMALFRFTLWYQGRR
jgi:hypothetical protein